MLSKEQAIEAMKAGKKVRHRYFTDDEWVRLRYPDVAGVYEFEDGVICRAREFWYIRRGPEWEDGWEIVE